MNIKRPLMPGFLKTAEQKLLLNKPGAWSTRTHLVFYYGVLFIIFLAGLCFLEPADVRAFTTTVYWIGFVSIICVIGLTAWLIYLLRFNVFKKYGNIHPLYMLASFILYFISTGIIVLFAYVHPVVESVRANLAYGDEEIVEDINAINIKVCQIEYDLLNEPWHHDTVSIVSDKEYKTYNEYEPEPAVANPERKPAYPYKRMDTATFKYKRVATDSIVKINDTLYDLFSTPNYTFITHTYADRYTKQHLLSSFEIYNTVFRRPQEEIDKAKVSKELNALLHKYKYKETLKAYALDQIDDDDTPFEIIHKKYDLGEIDASISHIVKKKYRWSDDDDFGGYVRVFYYVTLGITLLIFIFRHTTVKTFFLSLLAGLLLAIFTALIMSFSHAGNKTFLTWLIVYSILFFVGSLSTWLIKKRKVITGILINLFVFVVPVFPLLVLARFYIFKKQQIIYHGGTPDFEKLEKYVTYAEIAGPVLLLILLATYISKVYRRWYALPEE